MKYIKTLIIFMSLVGNLAAASPLKQLHTYGIHLYFNETEFIDVMTLEPTETGELKGSMYVPNDFDGKLENVKLDQQHLSFDLFVPKNSSRPEDLIFHYEAQFFDLSQKQLTGYVTIKGEVDFVASFVGFLRN